MNKTISPKQDFIKCHKFFEEVAKLLSDEYKVVASCNKDLSAYLVPKGTEKEITYESKPACSLRVSDHWNWYSNIKKCPQEYYVQCHSVDLPEPRKRLSLGKASNPIKAPQVCLIYSDGKYHCVFGRFFDRASGKWKWMTADPNLVDAVARGLLNDHKQLQKKITNIEEISAHKQCFLRRIRCKRKACIEYDHFIRVSQYES